MTEKKFEELFGFTIFEYSDYLNKTKKSLLHGIQQKVKEGKLTKEDFREITKESVQILIDSDPKCFKRFIKKT